MDKKNKERRRNSRKTKKKYVGPIIFKGNLFLKTPEEYSAPRNTFWNPFSTD